jgi:CRP/FNR family transcriptional regulator, anaerobic regulatory protein
MPILTTAQGPPLEPSGLPGQPVPAASQVIPFRLREELRRNGWDMRDAPPGASVPDAAVSPADDVKSMRRRVKAGGTLFHEGSRFRLLYAVRQGSFKSVLMLRGGCGQVTQFPMVGDLLGLDAIGRGLHGSSVVALEDSEVSAVPFQAVDGRPQAAWSASLCRLMSQERGYSATEFHMRMTRAEIGSYVGLTLETVSRALSAFQRRGWVDVEKRHITIKSLRILREFRDQDDEGE